MDQRYPVTHPDILNVQMDIQQLRAVQQSHAERLTRLEKRQADDAALKSVWGQPPFPNMIGGTPQQGPIRRSSREDLDDFNEQGQNLIASLHLEADDEPVRRGAVGSRANSVRFDESALQGANWGQNSRHSGDFGPIRPGSGFGVHGMMERSLSYKSDGRHSSAGHSVHSIHSAPSGRASSLGLDTNFVVGSGDEESPIDIPEPPPGLLILGSAPSIVRCWLTQTFRRDTLLFAVACTGSHKSTIEESLVKELDLTSEVHRDMTGVYRIRLPVYLTEAIVTQSNARVNGSSGERPIPSITTTFEVISTDQSENPDIKKAIQVVLGSDTLRAHSADLFLSRNTMTLLGDEREKLTVPFVLPEDEGVYKFLATANMAPGKPKLNANAAPFVSSNNAPIEVNGNTSPPDAKQMAEEPMSPAPSPLSGPETGVSNPSENGGDTELALEEASIAIVKKETNANTPSNVPPTTPTENNKRDSGTGGMWGPWRQQSMNGGELSQRDGSNSSGYQPAQRSTRSMKILKPSKLSGSARTGASYEPPPPPTKTSIEARRKSTAGSSSTENAPQTPVMRWDSKEQKRASVGTVGTVESRSDTKPSTAPPGSRELRSSMSRSANPVGGASAFKWMSSPGGATNTPTAVAD